jgi:hypothetical protein
MHIVRVCAQSRAANLGIVECVHELLRLRAHISHIYIGILIYVHRKGVALLCDILQQQLTSLGEGSPESRR